MKKHLQVISFVAATLGLFMFATGTALAAITATPTISSSSHSVSTSSTTSDISVSWTAATSSISGSSITYEYLLDGTATHTHSSFTTAKASADSTRAGQLSNTLSVKFTSVTDGTYYFHLRAYDTAGFVSGTAVLNFGPLILDSKPTLSSSPISPSSGDHSKAITVTISGSKFMSNATVKLVNGARSSGSNPNTSLSDVTLTNVTVDSANQITATIPSGTVPGTYDLTVSNGTPHSQSVTSADAYTSSNTAPTASAGSDQSGKLSSSSFSFTLSGSATDSDSDTLSDSSYSWTLSSVPTGVTETSSGWSQGVAKTGASQSVVVNTAGTYVFSLVVSDGYNNSTAATTTIIVSVESGNNKPVASAGVDQLVVPGATVTLTGSGSDVDGDSVTQYAWVLNSVPTGSSLAVTSTLPTSSETPATTSSITQANTGQASASFTPDVTGTYTVYLYVLDNYSGSDDSPKWSDGDSLTVTANNKPTASAGTDQTVGKDVESTLDGSGSTDSDTGEAATLSYTWSITSQPDGSSVSLSSISAQKPTFTPTVLGSYVFSLVVQDTAGNSSSAATVTVTAASAPATPAAGDNQTVEMVSGVSVSLAGTTSDSGSATYAWTVSSVPSGSSVATTSLVSASGTASTTAGALTGSFEPDVSGDYVLSLTVSNSANVASAADTLTITVNTRPVANAGSAQTANKGGVVTLDGSSSSDAEGNNLTYTWTSTVRPDGVAESDVNIVQASPSQPSATFAPATAGDYTFSLAVSDGIYGSTNESTVVVTVSDVLEFTLDVDGDNQYLPLTDGILIIRHLFKLTGSDLIASGVVGTSAARSDAEDITAYLDSNSSGLDVDNDGSALPLTDGILIIRHLFKLTGSDLIASGVVGANATRSDASDISAYLNELMPSQ